MVELAASIDRAGVRPVSLCTRNRIMNATAAHKDELRKLLEDLSSNTVVSGITFVALVDQYFMRLDTNCPNASDHANLLSAKIEREITYGTHIDSELRALLRATQDFKTARRSFPKISRCGPQASP